MHNSYERVEVVSLQNIYPSKCPSLVKCKYVQARGSQSRQLIHVKTKLLFGRGRGGGERNKNYLTFVNHAKKKNYKNYPILFFGHIFNAFLLYTRTHATSNFRLGHSFQDNRGFGTAYI